MNMNYVKPFMDSAMSVFSTMLKCQLTPGEPTDDFRREPDHDVTGIIGMSGKSTGVVMVHITKSIALNVTEAMLGVRPEGLNADVIDAVGELTNMIAGGAKAQLNPEFTNLALPMVLIGRNGIELPSCTKPTCVPFDSPWGALSVEIDVREPRKFAHALGA